jgi:hypothetical protein
VTAILDGDNVRFVSEIGPALLLTEDCQIDKRTSSGKRPKPASRFQLAPIRLLDINHVGHDRVTRLRAGDLNPPEMIYLDDAGTGEEAMALLGESFPLPSAYFQLELRSFDDHPDNVDDDDPMRMVAGRPGLQRSRTMTAPERQLLQAKLAFYWTHSSLEPREKPSAPQEP